MKQLRRCVGGGVERPDVGDAGLVGARQPVEHRVVVEPLDLVVDVAGLAGRGRCARRWRGPGRRAPATSDRRTGRRRLKAIRRAVRRQRRALDVLGDRGQGALREVALAPGRSCRRCRPSRRRCGRRGEGDAPDVAVHRGDVACRRGRAGTSRGCRRTCRRRARGSRWRWRSRPSCRSGRPRRRRRHQRAVGGEPGPARDARQRSCSRPVCQSASSSARSYVVTTPRSVLRHDAPVGRGVDPVAGRAGERARHRSGRPAAPTATTPYSLSRPVWRNDDPWPSVSIAVGAALATVGLLVPRPLRSASQLLVDRRSRSYRDDDHDDGREEADPSPRLTRSLPRPSRRELRYGGESQRSDDQRPPRPPRHREPRAEQRTTARRTPPTRPSGRARPRSGPRRCRWPAPGAGTSVARDGGEDAVGGGVEGAEQEQCEDRPWRRRSTATAAQSTRRPARGGRGPGPGAAPPGRPDPADRDRPARGRRRWCRRTRAGNQCVGEAAAVEQRQVDEAVADGQQAQHPGDDQQRGAAAASATSRQRNRSCAGAGGLLTSVAAAGGRRAPSRPSRATPSDGEAQRDHHHGAVAVRDRATSTTNAISGPIAAPMVSSVRCTPNARPRSRWVAAGARSSRRAARSGCPCRSGRR